MKQPPRRAAAGPLRVLAWAALAPALGVPLGAASAADLADVITNLYGGNGITIGVGPDAVNHRAHFESDSQQRFANLNEDVRSSLRPLGLNSTVAGFAFDITEGIPVRTEESLGPLLAERALTLGQGNLNVAFSYTRVEFDSFEGEDLDDLEILFDHNDCCPPPLAGESPGVPAFELDDILVDIDFELEQDIFAFFASYGITDRWDAGVILPVIRVEANARAEATIIDRSGTGVHTFVGGEDDPVSAAGGEETGIGDVLVRSKYNFLRDSPTLPDMAVLGQLTLPTGDEDDLLGTGETGVQALYIVSEQYGIVSPHLNIGYEVFTGDIEDNLRAIVGANADVTEDITVGLDLLGRLEPSGENDLLDLGVSARWNPFGDAILDAAVVLPLNRDDGLRSDFIWTVGFEYLF